MERFGALFLRVLTVSAGCSAVLAPLLLCSRRLREKIAARSFYVLFLLLAFRLMLPVEVKLPVPAVELPAPDLTLSVPARAPAQSPGAKPAAVQAPVQALPQPVKKVPVLTIAGVVWAAGMLFCAVWSVGSYLLVRKKLLRGSKPGAAGETALLDRLREELKVRRPVALCRSETAPGPLALGLLRPVIVLPVDGTPAEELVLRHELTHIRRRDVAYKLALSAACWVNWFNPLVWLMDKAAGRNLELCCDDEVTRDLSDQERRRYGNLLLDAAAVRPIPFSTCFSGGKTQMKERLLNLFTHKRNSAVLVCLVLAAALLAGGLVACEQAGAAPAITPQNQANRELLKQYFEDHFTEENTSVVLADLTGDGLDELLVLTMHTTSDTDANLRQPVGEEQFAYGELTVCGVQGGEAIQYDPMPNAQIINAHAGWGYLYLVPRTDGANGFALLEYSPYITMGMASYAYGLRTLNENGEWTIGDSDGVVFSVAPVEAAGLKSNSSSDIPSVVPSVVAPVEDADLSAGDYAAGEKARAFLERVQAYRDSGVPLLACYNDMEKLEFSYLNAPPADAFAGKLGTISALKGCVVTNGYTAKIPLPAGATEDAQERLKEANEARRTLLKDYFYASFKENEASVVLADLTGDGLDELLVLTMESYASGMIDLRQPVGAEQFSYGKLTICGEKDGTVFQYNSISDVANAHAGWGYVYLVPRSDGNGFAILDFRPYTGQGSASYTYGVYGLEGLNELDEWLWLDGGESYFSVDPVETMDPDTGDDATLEEVQAFLARVRAYRDSGVVLLAYNESYSGSTGGPESAYLNTAPADVFSGKIEMTVSGLREHVVSSGEPVQFVLPPAAPADPEAALDRLEASVESYPDGYVFRIPNYKGEWKIYIAGRMRMDHASHPAGTPDQFMSVHYLEGEEWKPGKRYSFETPEGAYYSELNLFAFVTTPDGTTAERTITLVEDGESPTT